MRRVGVVRASRTGRALVAALVVVMSTAGTAGAAEGPVLTYVVNAGPGGSVEGVREAVVRAGGTVTAGYDRIGVLVARSDNPDFAATLRPVPGVASVGATRTAPLTAARDAEADAAGERRTAQDPLEPQQWEMRAVKADRAHARTLGRRDVTVAVLDVGVDDTHVDIAPNFDREASANCVGGSPDPSEGAWRPPRPTTSHGTSVAGIVAAAKNGVGTVGVAPGVRVAGVKVASGGMFYAEAVVCGLVWATDHGADVTNMSFYSDPWYFNCVDDPDQKALLEAVNRAVRYAESRGVVNVAAAMNDNFDLAAPTIEDRFSPGDSSPVTRVVDRSRCFVSPTEAPGVIAVAATGAHDLKSSYSNHGLGIVDVAAPGGEVEDYQQPSAPAESNQILAPVPGGWQHTVGTSMAAPIVAGVAALIKSVRPHATPAQVRSLLFRGARPLPCPPHYDFDHDGTADAVCSGTSSYNGFYGHGLVDALTAVTR
ncbi:S8 family serine peptidase [Umezawaea endophytica]|uniref:S8 family serine peptidase n=1 Tax=Umezawaea endophytica TaxID=1654476 RepID=A0A9X2VVK6_9PSEU|nr:S8 family serine peptidase [Umezawaea endophytica]MCS7482483.1 S8 family serine peptidase [Umezawaea endophytica]